MAVSRRKESKPLTEAFETLPCHPLYEKLVRRQFKAKNGERNTILTHKIIPFLFGAVTESVAMQFAEAYYWYNAGIFSDPIEDHMKEARAAWKSCDANYRDGLTEKEREYFDFLGTVKKAEHLIPLFRICRSLAIETVKRHLYGLFDLSGEQCRLRLGLNHNEQGKRLLEALRDKYGVIEIEKYGEPRSKAFPSGIANVYRWMIENPTYAPTL